MNLGEVYFWTDTIKDWKTLLKHDSFKWIVMEQLQWLKQKGKIMIYGYVIMPNHLHLIWEMHEKNGKEMPYASFNKWTSHQFLRLIQRDHPQLLTFFVEQTHERNHRFWQRDALAVEVDSRKKLEQKLDYMHLNPLQERWNLAESPEAYRWSSANFYLTGMDEFDLITHYRERF